MSELLTFLTAHEERFRKGRLGALYSDFRHLRTTNPDGYSANISAWQKALTDASREGYIPTRGNESDILVLTVSDELLRALETKEWGRPLSLGAVIHEMISKKELIPIREFLDAKESIYRRPRVVSQLFYWSLRQLGFSGTGEDEEDRLPAGRFVVLSNVEEATKEASNRISTKTSRVERILSKDLFSKELIDCLQTAKHSSRPLSPTDLDILLKHLSRDKQLLAYDGQTIKIRTPGSREPLEITNEDTAIASIKTLITDLRIQNESLSNRIDTFSKNARDAVANKNIASARSILRSKKIAETTLSRRIATLSQLEEVYASIEQAADQVEFMHVMEISTGVLKGLNKEVGGVERVDRVVDQLREEMGVVDEIGDVVGEIGKEKVDEDEVGDELEVMEREEREKREAVEKAEREERERKEKMEKEERENKEAEETKRRLDAIPSIGGADKENESPVEENREGMKRLSLEAAVKS